MERRPCSRRSSISCTVKGDAELPVSSAIEKDAGLTFTQTGFMEPFSFTCFDMFSPYQTDTWSATGICSDGGEEGLECEYGENAPGFLVLTVDGNSGRLAGLRGMTMTNTSSYPENNSLSRYIETSSYIWEDYSPVDLRYSGYPMLPVLDAGIFDSSGGAVIPGPEGNFDGCPGLMFCDTTDDPSDGRDCSQGGSRWFGRLQP